MRQRQQLTKCSNVLASFGLNFCKANAKVSKIRSAQRIASILLTSFVLPLFLSQQSQAGTELSATSQFAEDQITAEQTQATQSSQARATAKSGAVPSSAVHTTAAHPSSVQTGSVQYRTVHSIANDVEPVQSATHNKGDVDKAKQMVENSRKLHIDRWVPKHRAPRAVIVAVHGTTQHAGSFSVLAEKLSEKGFIFIGLDLRGHGERFYQAFSGQPNHRVDYEASADDLGKLLQKVKTTYPNLPVFALGESVGAAVTTHCAGKYKGLMNGIILCSPGTRPRNFNPFMVLPDFVKGITHLDDEMDVSRYIDKYSSDDKRVSDEMIADPLSRIKLTPKEVLRTAFFIRTTPEAAKSVDPDVPVLIVQGEEDGIVSRGSTKAIMKNLPGDQKQLIEFKDAGHVLLGTSYLKPQVLESLAKWLSDQTDKCNLAMNRTKVIGLHDNPRESKQ